MKTRRKVITVLALLVVGVTVVSAQQHEHATGVVRGIEHPERIPDAVAYRAWFDSVSGMEAQHREDAIKKIGLTKADHDVVVVELDRYLVLRESLRVAYNKHQVETGGKDTASILKYQADVAALVEQAKKNIHSNLSAYAPALFDAHIQREKSGMTISESEASR